MALVSKAAVSQVEDLNSPGFYCRLFAVPKSTGGFRPILDLSPLNTSLRHIRFRMDTPVLVRRSMRPNDWSVSVDLRDAFFHVPIHPRDRKWLRFSWKTRVFQFQVLPFGLSQSPWVFTRMVRELVKWARVRGVRMLSHMDDWLILNQDRQACLAHLHLVLSQAQALGFQVHPDKSEFIPKQVFLYLGILFDTREWTVRPSQERLASLSTKLQVLGSRRTATPRQIASVLGSMESMALLLPLARVHKRPLQRQLAQHFRPPLQSWSKRLYIHPWFSLAVTHWLDPTWLSQSVPLTLPHPSHEVFVDASHQGWGAHTSSQTAHALWEHPDVGSHINHLELRAVRKALEAFQPHLGTGHILVWSDNRTVVALISHQGGTHSPSLSQETESLLLWASQQGWFLSARHVKGSRNVMADLLSRPNSILPTEWTLQHRVLYPLWQRWGRPTLDLFATKFNARLPVYVSPVPDDGAWEVDAMGISWVGLDAYAFPPFSLIPAVLQKAIQDQPRLILVVPHWPGMAWFNLISDMPQEPQLLSQSEAQASFNHAQASFTAFPKVSIFTHTCCAGSFAEHGIVGNGD